MGKLSKFQITVFVSTAALLILAGAIFFRDKVKKQADQSAFPSGQMRSIPEGYTRMQIPEREPPYFSLKPVTVSAFGILPKQAFDLATREPMDKTQLEKYLDSSTPMIITQTSPTAFRLQPQTSLGHDQVLSVKMSVKDIARPDGQKWDRDYGWSFQSQGKFRVTGSIPGDKKTDVPQNTGIELVFSQDDFIDPAPLIAITPPIQYRLERHGQSLAIVPQSPLAPKTVYTVTLKKGLNLQSRDDRITGDFTFSFQTAELESRKSNLELSVMENFVQVTPADPPIVKVYASDSMANTTVKAKIYKFNSGDDFLGSLKDLNYYEDLWYRHYQEDSPVNISNLGLVAEADLFVGKKEYLSFLQLPAPLPPGQYLVQFWYDNGEKLQQAWVQSSYLAAYTTVGRSQTLVWVNDIETRTPSAGAQVNVEGLGGGYYTGGNGIAVFSTPEIFYEKSTHFLQIKSASGQQMYLPVDSLNGVTSQNQVSPNDYWTYLYHERSMYRTTDTVYFWGVAKNRDTGQAPAAVSAKISTGYRYGTDQGPVTIVSKTIQVNRDGTYTGSLTYSDVPSDWYYLDISLGDVSLGRSGFTVRDFIKPEMKIEVSADRKAIFTDESVNYSGALSFFDGTPGKQIPLSIIDYGSSTSEDVSTDDYGRINHRYTPVYSDSGSSDYSRYPRYESVIIKPQLAKDDTIEGYGSVMVYGSRVMLTSQSSQEGSQAKVKAVVNRVDLSAVNNGTGTEVKGSLVANANVNLVITKSWWETKETGTYYDFIEKVTRPSYEYLRRQETLPARVLTSNSAGEVEFGFEMEKERTYTAKLEIQDENRHPYRITNYFYYYENYSDSGTNAVTPTLTMGKKTNEYLPGETVEAKITLGGKPYPDTDKNRFLFILATQGKQDFFTEDTPAESFTFSDKYIPNTHLAAVVFTGNNYLLATGACEWYCGDYFGSNTFHGIQLSYQKDNSLLNLAVETDKPKYRPGETAIVTITASRNGQPVAGAAVNTVLVDQALAAIGGVISPSPLADIYSSVPSQIYYTYFSHKPAFPSSAAEMGGGGGGESREIFKDTAYFDTSVTDSQGKAVFTVKLADNITSWIVYTQAVTSGLEAGHTQSTLPVTKEFFVTNEAPREYLLSDKPTVTAAGYGSALKSGDSINYETFLLIDEQALAKQEKPGQAFKEVVFPLPSLQPGQYRLAVKGSLGNLTDQVVNPLSIISSRVLFRASKNYPLSAGETLQNPEITGINATEMAKVTVSDQGQGKYYHQLFRYCYSDSNRLEKWVARTIASDILSKYFDRADCGEGSWDMEKFQTPDGGLAQVKWGGADLKTTVWALRANPDAFDSDKLIGYLQTEAGKSESGTLQKIYAAWGLTLLGQPQLITLDRLIGQAISVEEKLVGALALISSGQTEKARELYLDILADYAYTNHPYIRIDGTDADRMIEHTAWAILAGQTLESKYNSGLSAYLRDYGWQNSGILIDLALIASIDDDISVLPHEPTAVSLTVSGQQRDWNMSKGEFRSLPVLPSELSGLKVQTKSGKTEVRLDYYLGASGLNDKDADSRLSITRTYKKAKGEGDIKPGDIVQIQLRVSVTGSSPVGRYAITDYLPSGLVYLSNSWAYGLTPFGGMSLDNKQTVTGSYYFCPRCFTRDHGDRTYFARAAFSGEYTAEPATLQSAVDVSVWKSTGTDKITIVSR